MNETNCVPDDCVTGFEKSIVELKLCVDTCGDVLVWQVYAPDGGYIGGIEDAKKIIENGIIPERANPKHGVCSIGFCEKEQKWYGWSHRAMYGFGIGSVAEKGDSCTISGFVEDCEEFKNDTLPVPVGFEAKTLDDAKRMAIAFASSVS